ncbi:B-cell receptor CD22-like [Rhinoderma darwinii]|uniref:B-cell receptor CD22-like n=1 Tax=Rhinoderma darwinii TaxID=43563 RepID=UPI003F66B135
MAGVKQMFLLIICQGFYLGSVCQVWTFPSTITALIGSCVEIPCTYNIRSRFSRTSSTVWYLYNILTYPEILNIKDSSSVKEEYKDRTSLVPGMKSCTLRIDPVRREDTDTYYPGITEKRDINAYKKHYKTVRLDVTDSPGNIYLYTSEPIIEGEASVMRCAAEHTCRSRPPSLQWNKPGHIKKKSVQIYAGSWREESELTYIPSYVDDGTPVQCTATYPNGQRTGRSEILNIHYSPRNVTVSIIGKNEIIEGREVTLQCSGFSNPDVYEYEWYKGKEKTKLPDTGREITVQNVTRDTDPYSCAAINTVDAATGVHITVKNDSDVTELICDFLSSRPDVSHYTWMKDGSVLPQETGKTLTVYNNKENYGQYSCSAHNRAGDSSSEEIHMKR